MIRPQPDEFGLFGIELAGGRLDGYRELVRDLAPSRWYPAEQPLRAFDAVGGQLSLRPDAPMVEYRRTERRRPDGSVVYRFVPPGEAPGGRS